MTREEAIANLNMISVAFVEPVTKEQRKLIDDTFDMAIKALEQEFCEDAISRKAAICCFCDENGYWYDPLKVRNSIRELPSVNPQPKTGHWIYKQYGGYPEQGNYHCSECDKIDNNIPLYCPHCGAKMVKPQEREG